MISKKQENLDKEILELLKDTPLRAAEILLKDEEVQHLQEYANIVSIKRLGYNDHGPVHMRIASINAIKMANILHEQGIKFNLEKEGIGDFSDSLTAIFLATVLHDCGMSVSRESHEEMSVYLAQPIIKRILEKVYPDNFTKQVIVRTLAIEGIIGHMAMQKIHSLEAGLVMIADGCDMEKGRARIPTLMMKKPRVGDIHKYSASAINRVTIGKGEKKPIRITIRMEASVGIFQIEEVLFPKIKNSPVKPFIELYAGIRENELLRYL